MFFLRKKGKFTLDVETDFKRLQSPLWNQFVPWIRWEPIYQVMQSQFPLCNTSSWTEYKIYEILNGGDFFLGSQV